MDIDMDMDVINLKGPEYDELQRALFKLDVKETDQQLIDKYDAQGMFGWPVRIDLELEPDFHKHGKNMAGQTIHGRYVHEFFIRGQYDGSKIWLVENLKTGEAELWRTCDLTRMKRTGKASNRLGMSFRSTPRWMGVYAVRDEFLPPAKKRLEEIKQGITMAMTKIGKRTKKGSKSDWHIAKNIIITGTAPLTFIDQRKGGDRRHGSKHGSKKVNNVPSWCLP
jgi:hypothetical protein